jgi:uncharacterized membrane protein
MVFDFFCFIIGLFWLCSSMAVILGILSCGIIDIALWGNFGNPTAEPIRQLMASLDAMPALIPILVILFGILVLIIRWRGAIETWRGKDFRYPWLGAVAEHWAEENGL